MSEAEAFPIVPRPFTFQDVEGALIDGEWHVRDVALAERLGLERPTNVRRTIEAQMDELKSLGPSHAISAMVAIGSGARREVKEYYLNQPQVLLIAMLGRTEASRRLRADMIRVYNEWHASGMPAKVREATFWRKERVRLVERRLTLVNEMARARAAWPPPRSASPRRLARWRGSRPKARGSAVITRWRLWLKPTRQGATGRLFSPGAWRRCPLRHAFICWLSRSRLNSLATEDFMSPSPFVPSFLGASTSVFPFAI